MICHKYLFFGSWIHCETEVHLARAGDFFQGSHGFKVQVQLYYTCTVHESETMICCHRTGWVSFPSPTDATPVCAGQTIYGCLTTVQDMHTQVHTLLCDFGGGCVRSTFVPGEVWAGELCFCTRCTKLSRRLLHALRPGIPCRGGGRVWLRQESHCPGYQGSTKQAVSLLLH